MSILAGLADMLIGGGATGVISGGISMYAKLKEQKANLQHKEAEWKYTLEMTRENAKHEVVLADRNLLITKQQGSDSQRLAAIEAEGLLSKVQNVSAWVNNIRSLHRLVLSYVLIGVAVWMHWVAHDQALANITQSEGQMMLTIFATNAAASAVGFWFGDRVVSATPEAYRR